MKFEVVDNRNTKAFGEICLGTIFKTKYSDRYCMKIFPINGYNAVNIADGDGFKMNEDQMVILVNYQLTITEE